MAQQTVNVVDALNERILMADEKIRAAEARLLEVEAPIGRNALSAGGNTLLGFVVIGCGLLFVLVAIVSSKPFPAILAVVSLVYGGSRIAAAKERDAEMQRLREEASDVRRAVDKAKAERARLLEERREFLLGEEHRLRNQAPAPAVPQVAVVAAIAPPVAPDDTMECPRCAETIKARAKVCRYCGHELVVLAPTGG